MEIKLLKKSLENKKQFLIILKNKQHLVNYSIIKS